MKPLAPYATSVGAARRRMAVQKIARDLRQFETGILAVWRDWMPAPRLKEVYYYYSPLVAGFAFTFFASLLGLIFKSSVSTDARTNTFLDVALRNFDTNIFQASIFLLAFTAIVVGWRPASVFRRWVISPMFKVCHYLAMLAAGFCLLLALVHIPVVNPETFFHEVWVTAILILAGLLSAWGARYCQGEAAVVLLERSLIYRAALLLIGAIVIGALVAAHLSKK